MDSQISLRKEAIQLFLDNTPPTEIANELHVSRTWVYKWIKRYKGNPKGEWYKDESKAPQEQANKTSRSVEERIINIRQQLEQSKYAQIGAVSIQYEFVKLGLEPPPVWTINRVIKRNKLTRKGKRRNRKKKVIPNLF